MTLSRRQLLGTASAAAAALAMPAFLTRALAQDGKAKFTLPKLPYAYDALEPHIDAKTMEIHHTKHHQTYVDKLNAALDKHPDLKDKKIEELVSGWNSLPKDIKSAVRNNGGGHLNHTFFWSIMSKDGGKPSGPLADAITAAFRDLSTMQKLFKQAALDQFGSGWAWLVADKAGKLAIGATPNQDNPIATSAITPIIGLDVWEHAYYLKYQNKRADYIDAWFNVINWTQASEEYERRFKRLKGEG